MLEKLQETIINKDRISEIINKIGPDVFDIFKQIKYELGGKLPEDFSYGIVAGFLRGKGFTWEESFVGMNRFIQTVKGCGAESKNFDGIFRINGQENGKVEIELKDNK